MADLDLRQVFPDASVAFLRLNGLEPPKRAARRARDEIDAERALAFTSEAEFQEQVIALARQLGWHVVHINDSRRQVGGKWVGDADAADWPDLTLIRERLIFRELKKAGGKPTKGQEAMLDRLRRAGADAEVWWPTDWDAIHAALA